MRVFIILIWTRERDGWVQAWLFHAESGSSIWA